ncbi:MAG: prepilin-type N-terminal cleavage/methylation domain-containing protein, partial [Gemmatimonadaceae bacterium]|nr:prepilin-type N-terminal cleavage/methylation domain-containing protein [Gemmatimonadaceae bacterium]
MPSSSLLGSHTPESHMSRHKKGFTLIELLIVV